MDWIGVYAWIGAAVLAVIVLGFCGYELRWKAHRLRADLERMQELADQAGRLQVAAEDLRRRVAGLGPR